eukprot:GEMP01024766.1.p1 GENE.GEMP01024766.1~~GEMP01024766.1.p1  ORF type:complete len:560 (+),score=148.66 GEMP01024766.1:96-1775(+)
MGVETKATPLTWSRLLPHLDAIRLSAVNQFINHYDAQKGSSLQWGDEVEFMLVDFDDANKRVSVALRADKVLNELQADDPNAWRTEYANYMVEGVAAPPFEWDVDSCIDEIEESMRRRRERLLGFGDVLTMTNMPTMGTLDTNTCGPLSRSLFLPDTITSPHIRYQTLTANMRERKGCRMCALIPHEGRAPLPNSPMYPFILHERHGADLSAWPKDVEEGYAYMDCQAFGAGSCCMQATFGCKDLEEAKQLYDAFLVLSPIFLALTAGAPCWRGQLCDTDTRWEIMRRTWDDRSKEEVEQNNPPDARFYSPRMYLGSTDNNDVACPLHEESLKRAQEANIDPLIAKHLASLMLRDPLVVFEEFLPPQPGLSHWTWLNSTNWTTVRLKVPEADLGWRVEMRCPEVQSTDFENAGLVLMLRQVVEEIRNGGLELEIPISKVDENMETCAQKNAITEATFWFVDDPRVGGKVSRRTIASILFDEDVGILNLAKCSQEKRAKLNRYFDIYRRRARGEALTYAQFIRKQLSRSGDIHTKTYDLLRMLVEIGRQNVPAVDMGGQR